MGAQYTRFAAEYDSGARTFEFDSGLYAHASVKRTLIEAQHDKCCFCESKVTHIAYGDVEHYRPKKGYRQHEADPLGRPGYYWLAYEWDNLLFCCQLCNQRHKRNLFPLGDPGRRAKSHHEKTREEEPLFINPAQEDPEQHISFRMEMAFAVNGSPRGAATIEAIGLNRPKLSEVRYDHYKLLKSLYDVIQVSPATPEAARAQAFLDHTLKDDAPYASMIRAAVRAGFTI